MGFLKKILVIELWGIGDVVLATGVLRALRKNYPSAKINILAKEHAKTILSSSNIVDKFIIYDFPWTKFRGKYCFWKWDWIGLFRLIKRLRSEKFDLVLDARGDVRNNLLVFFTGAKRRVGYNWTGGGFLLTDVVKVEKNKLHRIDAWGYLLRYLGLSSVDAKPAIDIPQEEKKWADDFLRNKGINKANLLVGVHPGAGIKTRCWPLRRFVDIAAYLRQKGVQVVFFIEPGGYGDDIRLPEGCLKIKVCLCKYMAIVKDLDFLICNDGGAMHIATAVGTPVVAIFGPMEQEWFGPYGEDNVVIMKDNVSCRPCSDYCKHKEPYCLTGITEEQVIKQVDGVIDRIRKEKNGAIGTEVIH
jgi:ADP-heptose:LPS heptosyltransferase